MEIGERKNQTLILTAVVFVITQLVYMVLPQMAGMSYFDPMTWKHFDAGLYLSIATEGYTYMPCSENPDTMCGTAGWFPGFPLFVRSLGYVFGDTLLIGWFIALVFYFLSLFMVARISKLQELNGNNVINLCLAAFFLGSIYYMAIFPVSLVVFLSLWAFQLQLNGKYVLAALPVFLCSITYPTGSLLAGVLAVQGIIMHWKDQRLKAFWNAALVLGSGLMGVVLVFLMFEWLFGDWRAFLEVQAKYGHGLHFPIRRMYEMYLPLADGFSIKQMDIVQSTLVIIGYFWLLVRFFRKKQHRNPLFLLTFLFVSAYFWFPWTVGGNLSRYRAEALLMPAVFLIFDTKMKFKLGLLSIFLMIGIVMSYLFFIEVLI